ncbi:MAG: hypothetical protein NVSMB22_28060 [Chloroflexota bacterium]
MRAYRLADISIRAVGGRDGEDDQIVRMRINEREGSLDCSSHVDYQVLFLKDALHKAGDRHWGFYQE